MTKLDAVDVTRLEEIEGRTGMRGARARYRHYRKMGLPHDAAMRAVAVWARNASTQRDQRTGHETGAVQGEGFSRWERAR